MHHCAEDHDAAVVALSLVAAGPLEVEDLDGTVFARHEEPLVLSLEFHSDGIAGQAIESHLLALVKITHIKHFHEIVCAGPEVPLILAEN